MRVSVVLFLVAEAGLAPRASAAEPTQVRPNVLFIAVDDLNDWITCLGGRKNVHTPNLDRLAKRGVLFTNAHCAAPSCNPSRVAMMTGVAPSSSGIYNNGQQWRESPRLAKAVTLPEHFRNGGYTAYGGGKIFHALSWITHGYGKQQNEAKLWDHYWPSATSPMPKPQWPSSAAAKRTANGYLRSKPIAVGKDAKSRPPHYFDWAPDDQPESGTADYQVVDWAIGELAKKRDKPFFHAVGIFRPHIPWYAPTKYFDVYPAKDVFLPTVKDDDLADVPPAGQRSIRKGWHRWLVANDEWRAAVRGYLASISFADAQVGRLIDALDKSPHANNTIIVLLSDHGMHLGEKQQWEKFTLFEEATRVPLIVIAPGVTQAGSVCSRPVSLLDVYPTLNELCSLARRDDLDGESLVPLLRNPLAKRERPAVTTWGKNNHAARGERYRYIRHPDGTQQLYDHEVDPNEWENLAGDPQFADVIASHRKWLPKPESKLVPDLSGLSTVSPTDDQPSPFSGASAFDKQRLFDDQRYPNVVVTVKGSVLAVWGNSGVVVRRSEDGGKSWDRPIPVARSGYHGGGTIVDSNSGDILVFVEERQPPAPLTLYRSRDDGRSWHPELTIIEKDVNGNRPSMHMNEHGVTLLRGPHKGRLLRPSRYYGPKDGKEHWPKQYTNAIYSDDGGKTWKTSKPFPENGTGEAALVELADGRIYYNSRVHWPKRPRNRRRREAWSVDGGASWQNWRIVDVLPDGDQGRPYGCMGGLTRLPVHDRDILIFSNLDTNASHRERVTVWASFDGGKTWPVKRLVDEGRSGYSSLAVGRPGTPSSGWIYLHYEHDPFKGSHLARFNLAWVLGGQKTGDGELPPLTVR